MAAPRRLVGLLILEYNAAMRQLLKAKRLYEEYLDRAEPYEADADLKHDVLMARKVISKLSKLEDAMNGRLPNQQKVKK